MDLKLLAEALMIFLSPALCTPSPIAVHSATTWGNSAWVAISGGIARLAGDSIASAAPNTNAIANSGHTTPGSQRL